MKFEKSICEKYVIHLDHLQGWAIIFLDKTTVSIHSDYGNWSYSWTNHGCESLKRFLVQTELDYLGNKFCNGKTESDYKDSIKRIRQDVIQYRKEEYITKEEARDALDHLKNDDLELYSTNDDLFLTTLLQEKVFYKIYEESGFPITKKLPRQFEMFYERIWKVFIEELKKELDNPDKT